MLTREQKKNRKIWVEALRSGKYKRTTNAMVRLAPSGPRFCCLGVAAHVLDPRPWEVCGGGRRCVVSGLSLAFLDKIGLEIVGMSRDQQHLLAQLNDNGMTFSRIADQIDAWTKEGR